MLKLFVIYCHLGGLGVSSPQIQSAAVGESVKRTELDVINSHFWQSRWNERELSPARSSLRPDLIGSLWTSFSLSTVTIIIRTFDVYLVLLLSDFCCGFFELGNTEWCVIMLLNAIVGLK